MAAATPVYELVLPTLIDNIANQTPARVFASVPKSSSLKDGWRDITFRELSRAINRLAAFLEPHVGHADKVGTSCIAYIGINDPRCIIVSVTLQKLGHYTLLSAPRNTQAMHLNLMQGAGCKTLLHVQGINSNLVIGRAGIKAIEIPSLFDLLDENGAVSPIYNYTKSFDEIKLQPWIVLHTSGSTGMPKPISITPNHIATMLHLKNMDPVDGKIGMATDMAQPHRRYTAFPIWHAAGMIPAGFVLTLVGDSIYVFGPPDLPPSGPVVLDVLKYARVSMALLPPISITEAVKIPGGLDALGQLESIYFGGGAVEKTAGDVLAKRTRLQTIMCSTEGCHHGIQLLHDLKKDRDLWDYSQFSPKHDGVEFRNVSPGIYEQVFVRRRESQHFYAIWHTFPKLYEYHTKDLFERHPDPSRSNYYRHVGRTDDMIVFNNGAKYNPLRYETQVLSNPLVSAALVVGTKRDHPALVVELNEPCDANLKENLKNLWPTIEKANFAAPKHGVISKDMVLVAVTGKDFPRASKGTIIRSATVQLYEPELNLLYKRQNNS